jgi:hypothetical protein
MQDETKCNSNPSSPDSPSNAFHPEFLRRRQDREDEPLAAVEAENRGPWVVLRRPPAQPTPGDTHLWEVYRSWEDPGTDRPAAAYRFRELAYLYAAALEVGGRLSGLRVADEPTAAGGYEVLQTDLDGKAQGVGRIAVYDSDVFAAFRNLESLLRSPESPARVLEAAGSVIMGILGRRLMRE